MDQTNAMVATLEASGQLDAKNKQIVDQVKATTVDGVLTAEEAAANVGRLQGVISTTKLSQETMTQLLRDLMILQNGFVSQLNQLRAEFNLLKERGGATSPNR